MPENASIWDWLFGENLSPLRHVPKARLGAFCDAQTGDRISFDVLKQYATDLSTVLARKYGLKERCNIAIACENSIWYPVVVFAALRLGAVVTAISPSYGPEELVRALRISKSTLIFTDKTSIKAASAAVSELHIPSECIIRLDRVSGQEGVADLVRHGLRMQPIPQSPIPVCRKSSETCAFLSFTSGTIGLPKAVCLSDEKSHETSTDSCQIMISHRNVIAQAYQVLAMTKPGPAQKLLGVLPLCHSKFAFWCASAMRKVSCGSADLETVTGIVHILQLPLLLNQEVVLMAKFTMKSMLETVVKYQCQELWLVPRGFGLGPAGYR